MKMNVLHVNVNKLIVNTRYTVISSIQFTGTFSVKDSFGGIVFRNVVYIDGNRIKLINIPVHSITNASVVVNPYLVCDLNREINHF